MSDDPRGLLQGAPDEGWKSLAARLDVHAIAIGVRRIQDRDHEAFPPAEPQTPVGLARARASGAARIVARELLARLGGDPASPLPRGPGRAPVWPPGFLGSLAHDDDYAVAIVARAADARALGVDIEPPEPLPLDVSDFALSARERAAVLDDARRARLIFCAKEAVYKAMSVLEGAELDYADIEIRLNPDAAFLRDGRTVGLIAIPEPRCVAVAFL